MYLEFTQLYHRGCPSNVEEFEPYILQSFVLVALIGIMILCLRYQGIHGGRSIIPSFLQPARYDYFVKYDPERVALELGPMVNEASPDVASAYRVKRTRIYKPNSCSPLPHMSRKPV